jgi:hypothetical protein
MTKKLKSTYENANEKIFSLLFKIGLTYSNSNLITKITFLTCILVIKNDFSIQTANISGAYLPAANALPKPIGYFSESLGNLVLVRLFQINSIHSWIILHIILIFVFLIILILIIQSNNFQDKDFYLLMVFTTPALSVILQQIGNYDSFTFMGGVLFIFLKSKLGAFISALMMTLGNPEQAVLAFLCVYCLSYISQFRLWRSKCVIGLTTAISIWITIQCWMFINHVPATRLTLLPHFIDLAVLAFWANPLKNLWSYLGILWFVILYSAVTLSKLHRKMFLAAVIIIPLCATLITADGVRVFALINLPTLFIVINWFWSVLIPEKYRNYGLGIYLIIWILLPSGLYSNRTLGEYIASIFSNSAGSFGKLILDTGIKFLA